MSKNTPQELTVQEFAKELGVSHDMVTRWVRAGKIQGRKKNPFAVKTTYLIPASEIERVKKLMEPSGNGHQ